MKLITGQRMLCNLTGLGPGLEKLPLGRFRQLYDLYDRLFGIPRDLTVQTSDMLVPAEGHEIPIRLYRPQGDAATLSMVYFHGGGYVIGSLESHDSFCRMLASRAHINVIAVDYRLAPECKFPGPLEDSLMAWNWVVENAASLQLGSGKIGIGGDSAGGNIAAVLAMQLFSEALPGRRLSAAPAFQFLLYPLVDFGFRSESINRYGKGLVLTEAIMHFFRDSYINDEKETALVSASPILAHDLSMTPDSIIVTAEYDVLRDEGLEFVDRLRQAQVALSHLHLEDCTHQFISMARFSRATRDRLEDVCAMLANYRVSN